MTTTITNEAGTRIDFDAAVAMMDDDLRESIHLTFVGGEDDSPIGQLRAAKAFFDAYCAAHSAKFGEEFEPNKRNPTW